MTGRVSNTALLILVFTYIHVYSWYSRDSSTREGLAAGRGWKKFNTQGERIEGMTNYYMCGAVLLVVAYVFRVELKKIGEVGHGLAMEFNSGYLSDEEEEGDKKD